MSGFSMDLKGYVYILTNPSFREDWVKIGKSKRLPEIRGRELYNTAVPLPFEIYATLKTEKYNQAEKLIHRSIDRISDLRINKSREFFKITPEEAYEIFYDIKELLGDEAELELHGDNVEVKTEKNSIKRKSSQLFSFYSKGIEEGEIIKFVDDESIIAIVAGPRQVLFEGSLWYLSPLARELFERQGRGNASGAYQGPLFFTYNGVRLTEISNIE
jgi:hypothetical protein